MSLNLIANQPQVSVGLPTFTYTIPSAGIYFASVQTSENVPSSVAILVKNNGSTVYTAPTLSPTQGALQFKYAQLYAASDVLTVVVSSGAAIDNKLNTVQVTCAVGLGA